MKALSALCFCGLFSAALSAQNIAENFRCAFDGAHAGLLQKDPGYRAATERLDSLAALFAKENGHGSGGPATARANFTIPIVVHLVVPPGAAIGQANNLTDQQVEDGLALLNSCFANAGPFTAPNGTDIGIEFCLARRDPLGNPTDGITRHESPLVANATVCPPFGTDYANASLIKKLANWDCKQYLNFWLVTDMFDGGFGCPLAGYAFFPGAPCGADGIIQESQMWVSEAGTRITAHEAGHYLGLHHTFLGGCSNGNCLSDGDRVCDTPPDSSPHFAPCDHNSCDTDLPDLPDDNTNIMDYTNCKPFHFTEGQRLRMVNALLTSRSSLLSSLGCEPVADVDAFIYAWADTTCPSSVCPKVFIKNKGTSGLTSLFFKAKITGGAEADFQWTGNLAPFASTTIKLPCLPAAPGNYEVLVEATAPNGGPDGNPANNLFLIKNYAVEKLFGDFTSVANSSTATFTNLSTGATTYFWEFGDGGTSMEKHPSHTYAAPGSYSVTLTASNSCTSATAVRPVVISGVCSGPVAVLLFGGSLNDSSGNGNDGFPGGQTSGGPTPTADRFGNPNSALLFGGYNDKDWVRVKNNPSLQFDKQMTVALWFKQCAFEGMDIFGNLAPDGYHILFSKAGDGLAADPGFWSDTRTDSAGVMSVSFDNVYNADMQVDTTITCFDSCEWVHYALVVDYSTIKIYFNGKLQKVKTGATVNFNNANNRDFFIGRMNGGGNIWYPFNGIIDDVYIYKCALAEADILKLFDDYKDPLIQEYDIDITAVATTIDICRADSAHSISIEADPAAGPYEFSVDGANWQPSGFFEKMPPGQHLVRVRNLCGYADTLVKIEVPPVLGTKLLFQEGASCKAPGRFSIEPVNGLPPFLFRKNNGAWQADGLFEGLPPGPYTATVQDAKGCTAQRTIEIADLPATILIKTDSLRLKADCRGPAFVALRAEGGSPLYYFSLDGAQPEPVDFYSGLAVGAHTITVFDENGCTGPPFKFNVLPATPPQPVVSSPKTCHGTGLAVAQHFYEKSGTYLDTLRSAAGCDSLHLTTHLTVLEKSVFEQDLTTCPGEPVAVGPKKYGQPGTYLDTLQNSFGCDSFLTTRLLLLEKPLVERAFHICPGDTARLADGRFFTLTGVYKAVFKTTGGCDSTELTRILQSSADFCDSLRCRMFVPNAISPDGDGLNDVLEVFAPVSELSELLVFSQGGELLFKTGGPDFSWDAIFRGEKVRPGVYVWVLKGACADGRPFLKAGDVTVVR